MNKGWMPFDEACKKWNNEIECDDEDIMFIRFCKATGLDRGNPEIQNMMRNTLMDNTKKLLKQIEPGE